MTTLAIIVSVAITVSVVGIVAIVAIVHGRRIGWDFWGYAGGFQVEGSKDPTKPCSTRNHGK